MEKIKPLASFPVIATSQVEEAEYCISQSITDVQINQVDDQSNFRLELNAVNFDRFSLLYNYFGTRTELTTGQDMDHALFVTGINIPIKLDIDNQPLVVTRNKAAIIASANRVRVERPAQSDILYLRVSLSELWSHFETLTARHYRGAPIFDKTVSVATGSGAMLKGLMDYLVNLFARDDSIMKILPIRRSFDDFLMSAMLSLPHNKIDQLYEDHTCMVAPAVVCQAEEYMRAHLQRPVTISDLIRVCNCSRSVLFAAFRNARDYTPMEFLTEQRLHMARERLQKARYNASVSTIAADCGFISLSWFSQVYKKRFGERPSDTLRRGK